MLRPDTLLTAGKPGGKRRKQTSTCSIGRNRSTRLTSLKGGYMMAVIFSAREIVEAAVEKEKKRKGFYANVCELSTNEDMKDLFQFLIEEEEKHVAAFAQIRDNLPEETHSAEYSADMQAYMDSVVDDRLYSDIDSKGFVQEAINAKHVFRLAIGFEKDAILYLR